MEKSIEKKAAYRHSEEVKNDGTIKIQNMPTNNKSEKTIPSSRKYDQDSPEKELTEFPKIQVFYSPEKSKGTKKTNILFWTIH